MSRPTITEQSILDLGFKEFSTTTNSNAWVTKFRKDELPIVVVEYRSYSSNFKYSVYAEDVYLRDINDIEQLVNLLKSLTT